MLLYIFATFCIGLAASYSIVDKDFLVENNYPKLRWPVTFHTKATKVSLTSDLTENFEAWNTANSSRIEYNFGSAISITLSHRTKKYEIHPETTNGQDRKIVCNEITFKKNSYKYLLNSILPPIGIKGRFHAVGNETIHERKTVRFEYTYESNGIKSPQVIWAAYESHENWVPVRYEKKFYNSELGSLITHEIWDYYNFSDFVDEDKFNISEFGCTGTKVVKHSTESDKVIKELMFIDPDNQEHVDHVFNKYIDNFKRKYAHEKEHVMRRAIFNENMRMVRTVNRQNAGYKLAINQFSDRTLEELEWSMGLETEAPGETGNIEFPYNEANIKEIIDDIPKEYDLRLLGLVGPVKSQRSCGSCWSFGTTAAVEGALARVNGGRLLSLANQALVDCAWSFGTHGCNGGNALSAYKWMMEYGLPTEEEYGSYKNTEDFCHIANMSQVYPIRGFTKVTPFSNEATKVAVFNYGPLAVSVNATKQFVHYSSGIFYQYNCEPLPSNHAVTMVGYGERYGDLFWILKNSWGTNWGIDGYMLIAAKDNTCGTTTKPTYVVF